MQNARNRLPQKDGASQPTGQVLAELNRAKALFQMRALATVMGCPTLIRDVDGDGLKLTVEPLQFFPAGRTQEGAGGCPPIPVLSANDSTLHHEATNA